MVIRAARALAAVVLCLGLGACAPADAQVPPTEAQVPPADPQVTENSSAPDDYQFSHGFSNKQGLNQWSYAEWNGSAYAPMHWDQASQWWRGSCAYCVITREWEHPDGNDAVIVWTAPKTGTVTVRGTMDHVIIGGSDGVRTMIRQSHGTNLRRIW